MIWSMVVTVHITSSLSADPMAAAIPYSRHHTATSVRKYMALLLSLSLVVVHSLFVCGTSCGTGASHVSPFLHRQRLALDSHTASVRSSRYKPAANLHRHTHSHTLPTGIGIRRTCTLHRADTLYKYPAFNIQDTPRAWLLAQSTLTLSCRLTDPLERNGPL